MNDGLGKLLERAPCEMGRFEKTEYPDPVVLALHGKIVKVMDLKERAEK